MSTSDQDGRAPLTRKQLREIRLTGSTPVITEEEAASAAARPSPATVLPRAADPVEVPPAPDVAPPASGAPLTRRQMRALEHADDAGAPAADDAPAADLASADDAPAAAETDVTSDQQETDSDASAAESEPSESDAAPEQTDHDDAPETQPSAVVPSPLSAPADEPMPRPAIPVSATDEGLVAGLPSFAPAEAPVVPSFAASADVDLPPVDAREQVAAIFDQDPQGESDADAVTADELPEADTIDSERPQVGAAFGLGVKAQPAEVAADSLFDEILDGETSGSHHTSSTALIFTPALGAGSLSGPITSTGEMLITGTYALPEGLGSQGHAVGAADGKDVDAVLLDGELAPSSSPTPIAASSAVSTSKPAGEVIRPPAPDTGNKLMLTLAIVAGGLALALATALIIAFTGNVF